MDCYIFFLFLSFHIHPIPISFHRGLGESEAILRTENVNQIWKFDEKKHERINKVDVHT